MSVIASRRALNRFNMVRVVDKNWNLQAYRVKPRGFDTALFEIVRPEGTSERDFNDFLRAVEHLCDSPVK